MKVIYITLGKFWWSPLQGVEILPQKVWVSLDRSQRTEDNPQCQVHFSTLFSRENIQETSIALWRFSKFKGSVWASNPFPSTRVSNWQHQKQYAWDFIKSLILRSISESSVASAGAGWHLDRNSFSLPTAQPYRTSQKHPTIDICHCKHVTFIAGTQY